MFWLEPFDSSVAENKAAGKRSTPVGLYVHALRARWQPGPNCAFYL